MRGWGHNFPQSSFARGIALEFDLHVYDMIHPLLLIRMKGSAGSTIVVSIYISILSLNEHNLLLHFRSPSAHFQVSMFSLEHKTLHVLRLETRLQ